jgi:hypothetical protein
LKSTSLDPLIPWFNYWDRSDPVGYGLAQLRPNDPSSDAFKMFAVRHDHCFARYPIPGMAHIGYWTDQDIHRDILQKLMGIGGVRTVKITNRWWGREWLMRSVEVMGYGFFRSATLAAIVFFLMRLLEWARPLHDLQGLIAWVTARPGFPRSVPNGMEEGLAALVWLTAPALILKLWSDWETRKDTKTNAGTLFRTVLLGLWLILLALTLPDCATCAGRSGIKDLIGYAGGLVLSLMAWRLHTTIHKGIVQLWRYTGGQGTVTECSAALHIPTS